MSIDLENGGLWTADRFEVGTCERLVLRIGNPDAMFVNLFKGRNRVTLADLEESLAGEVQMLLGGVVARYPAETLFTATDVRGQIESGLRQAISVTVRRACSLLRVARSSLNYASRLDAKDADVIAAMKRLSAQYPRYGYRRIQVFLEREGYVMGPDRAHRRWKQAGLQVPRKRPRRRVASGRARPMAPTGANQVWAYDFVFDACANGQQLKCLTIVDEYTRECLAIDVAGSIRSKRVIEVLSRLVSVHGAPLFLRSDNGPEFVSRAILEWIAQSGIATALIDPGKPWQNANNESFYGKFRDECLSLEWFRSRAEAKVVIETWRRHYNNGSRASPTISRAPVTSSPRSTGRAAA